MISGKRLGQSLITREPLQLLKPCRTTSRRSRTSRSTPGRSSEESKIENMEEDSGEISNLQAAIEAFQRMAKAYALRQIISHDNGDIIKIMCENLKSVIDV